MDVFIAVMVSLTVGIVLGYMLATHIHSIANAAAARGVSAIGSLVGETATLTPPAATPPAPPKV